MRFCDLKRLNKNRTSAHNEQIPAAAKMYLKAKTMYPSGQPYKAGVGKSIFFLTWRYHEIL
jgi:hypothetical protein